MAKRKRSRQRKGSRNRPVPVINPNAAGIDVGAREIYVALPADRDPSPRISLSWRDGSRAAA